MIKLAVVGLGKMGLSHLAILNAHAEVSVVAICDSSSVVLSLLRKYTGLNTYADYDAMLAKVDLDAVVIATPSRSHAPMVRAALDRGLHVFCEKPFTLSADDSLELAAVAEERGLVTQVGYHNRFVGAFREVKRLLETDAIGRVTHGLGEGYGPVVLKAAGSTWRSKSTEGGGCLYDYAAHPVDLLTWYLGDVTGAGGTVLNSIFSREIDDQVLSTLHFSGGRTAQVSADWSDESQRKMATRITLWGTAGRIYADRQEVQVYLRENAVLPPGYTHGWNTRYTTDLTEPVSFYLRGEEYSAQLHHFIQRVKERKVSGVNSFQSAQVTDRAIALMIRDAQKAPTTTTTDAAGGDREPADHWQAVWARRVARLRGSGARGMRRLSETSRRRSD